MIYKLREMSKLISRPNSKSNAANFNLVGVNRNNKFRKVLLKRSNHKNKFHEFRWFWGPKS